MPDDEVDVISAYVAAYGRSYIHPGILLQFIKDLRSDPAAVKLRGIHERWWKERMTKDNTIVPEDYQHPKRCERCENTSCREWGSRNIVKYQPPEESYGLYSPAMFTSIYGCYQFRSDL